MMNKIDIISFLDNRAIFSDTAKLEEKFDLNFFSFKRVSFEQFIVMDNFKKIVVLINEVFTINENQFVFNFHDHPFRILSSRYDDADRLLLIEKKFFEFIKQIIANLKNIDKSYLKKCVLFLSNIGFFVFLSCFIFFDENHIYQEYFDSNKFELQKNIYAAYSKITSSAVEMPIQEKIVIENKELDYIKEPVQKATGKKNKIAKLKIPEIDSELSYFLNMIKNKKNKK